MSMESTDTTGNIAPNVHLRVSTFGRFQIEWLDPETGQIIPLPSERLRGQNAATDLGLFKALLSCPDRFATRSWLLEQFWPDSRHRSAEERLTDVVSSLRTLLRPKGSQDMLVHFVYGTKNRGAGFRLDAYPQLWCDADAFEWYVKHAMLLDQRGQDSTACWERAYMLAERGTYLPEQIEEDWTRQWRDYLQGLVRDCVQGWTLLLRQMGHVDEAIMRLRSYWLEHLTDEDALRPLIEMLGERERFGEAEECYAKVHAVLAGDGHAPDNRTIEAIEAVRALKIQRTRTTEITATIMKLPGRALFAPPQRLPDRMLLKQVEGEQSMGLPRRNLIRGLFGITGTTLFPSEPYLDLETLERLSRALQSSSDLDEMALTRLEIVTKNHRYEFVQSDGRTWYEIFQEMSGHLRIIAQLLERHVQHPYLCTIAGETTLLLGDLLFNAGENGTADRYYQSAFEASKGNRLLQAVILGRRALIPIYDHCPQKAIPLIDEAQQIIPATAADMICAYLWSVKGEAYASLGEDTACFQALHAAEQLVERERSGEISLHFQPEIAYATFDRTKFSGYRGICLLRLNRSEPAQDILHDQLLRVEERALIHQQSIASVDLAVSFAQQTSIRHVYEYATNALRYVEETKSGRVFQRILTLRQSLNPWVNTTYVKNLDEHIHVVASDLMKGVQ